jgi:hypothetical protein
MTKSSIPTNDIIRKAVEIVDEAKQIGGIIRIIGGLAILIHSLEYENLFYRLDRLGLGDRQITDIDFITYRSSIKFIDQVLQKLGYKLDYRVALFYGDSRRIYYSNDGTYQVDIFIERLNYNHLIEFSTPGCKRLELDYPTITPSDLLLEKLQIHKIAEKDIKDIILLLRAHELKMDDYRDAIDLKRLEDTLGKDWGFWYETKLNLKKVLFFTKKYVREKIIDEESAQNVDGKVSMLLKFLDEMPKTSEWIKRANIGDKKKWWKEIE